MGRGENGEGLKEIALNFRKKGTTRQRWKGGCPQEAVRSLFAKGGSGGWEVLDLQLERQDSGWARPWSWGLAGVAGLARPRQQKPGLQSPLQSAMLVLWSLGRSAGLGDRKVRAQGPKAPGAVPWLPPASHSGLGPLRPAPMGLSLSRPLSAPSCFPSEAENGSLVTNMASGHWVMRSSSPARHKGTFCSPPCPSRWLFPGPPTHRLPPARASRPARHPRGRQDGPRPGRGALPPAAPCQPARGLGARRPCCGRPGGLGEATRGGGGRSVRAHGAPLVSREGDPPPRSPGPPSCAETSRLPRPPCRCIRTAACGGRRDGPIFRRWRLRLGG